MDPESQNNIAFGSIYNNRVSMSDDTESGMLDYSKPEYASFFTTYVDSKISPLIQPYDNSMQTMKFSIGLRVNFSSFFSSDPFIDNA